MNKFLSNEFAKHAVNDAISFEVASSIIIEELERGNIGGQYIKEEGSLIYDYTLDGTAYKVLNINEAFQRGHIQQFEVVRRFLAEKPIIDDGENGVSVGDTIVTNDILYPDLTQDETKAITSLAHIAMVSARTDSRWTQMIEDLASNL